MEEIYGVIYIIKNNINNKIYVGQTTKNFNKRYNYNLYNSTHNEHLKHSIEKYGIENFTIIKEFDVAHSKEELDALEDMYIKIYNTTNSKYGYNKKFGGANGLFNEDIKLRIDNLKDTSIIEIGSSATISFGFKDKTRAINIL